MAHGEVRSDPVPTPGNPRQKPDENGRNEEELGYGHPAHRPDPSARYGFDPGPRRTLPVDPKKRWR